MQLVLKYKDDALTLDLLKAFYVKQELEPGKNLYQILFEKLIKGEVVSYSGLVRRYKRKLPTISCATIDLVAKRIKKAAENSPNARLRELNFVRPPWGGASKVIERKSKRSRYMPAQKRIILGTIRENPHLLPEKIRELALEKLAKYGLDKNVVVGHTTILKYRKELGLLTKKPKKTKPPTRRRALI